MEDYFIKLPNRFFYSNDDKVKSILRITNNDKTLLVLDYLYTNTNRKGIVKFTLEDMITECGFKCSTKKGESNEQFKSILSNLHKASIVSSDLDFMNIKPRDLISCSLSINLDEFFVILNYKEKDVVLNQTITSCDNLKLLIYYCYLKSRMYKRNKDDSMQANGGRAEVTWVTYKTINKDLGLTDETIKKYNDLLIELNLIRVGYPGNYYYKDDENKVLRESSNIYTLLINGDEVKAKANLKEGIKYYKSLEINSNKVFTNSKEYKNNNRKLNGKLGSIIKKEKLGTATEEDIKIKNQIIESISENADKKFKIKALLDSNKGDLLSDIYDKLCKHDLYNEYCDLETELGLVDSNGNLNVDWDYYCYIMVNYNKDEHEKYKNYVRKHIRDCNKSDNGEVWGQEEPDFNSEEDKENIEDLL